MEEYQQQTQNKFGLLLARKEELDIAIEGLEIALSENDTYRTLVKLKEEREHLFDDFKANALQEFSKRKIKTIDGDFGKITMRENVRYKVVDESKIPQQYFKPAVDMNAIKKAYLLNQTVEGIEKVVSRSMILTPKQTGESS